MPVGPSLHACAYARHRPYAARSRAIAVTMVFGAPPTSHMGALLPKTRTRCPAGLLPPLLLLGIGGREVHGNAAPLPPNEEAM